MILLALFQLYVDWQADAPSEALFGGGYLKGIREELASQGEQIERWPYEAYRMPLLNWKGVHSLEDLKAWLLPKPVEVEGQWVFWNLGPRLADYDFSKVPKEKLVLFLWEPPTVQPESYDPKTLACFEKVFTWDDDLVDNVKFFKFYYPVLGERLSDIPDFEKKKFCTLIATRLSSRHPKEIYSERESMIRFFEDKPGEFDLYGKHWEKRNYKNWRGPCADKYETLKQYRFSICYENMRDVRGYITEKIFDCFIAGVIPVYWGASNIAEVIPKNCFIDRRDFPSNQAVYDRLKAMDRSEYETYLRNAALFLKSEAAQPFSQEQFIKNFINKVTYK